MLITCDECGIAFNKGVAEIKRTSGSFCGTSCAGTFNGKKRKGPYGGAAQKEKYRQARELRIQGHGYRSIFSKIGVPVTTVARWTKDIKVSSKKARKKYFREHVIPIEDLKSTSSIRARLLLTVNACQSCGISEWKGNEIVLELHHKDGNGENDDLENLTLLCPNCHSQTDNYRNRKRLALDE